MEQAVFVVGAAICLLGAVGVIVSKNPVHSALSLVGTLFGISLFFTGFRLITSSDSPQA